MSKLQQFNKNQIKKDIPDIHAGDTIIVHQKIKEDEKERIQQFKGMVISRKHKNEIGATITVRKIVQSVGVEKTFPLHSPLIDKIEIIKRPKVHRAKLYYMRRLTAKKVRAKTPTKMLFSSPEQTEKADKETTPEKKEEEVDKKKTVPKEENKEKMIKSDK